MTRPAAVPGFDPMTTAPISPSPRAITVAPRAAASDSAVSRGPGSPSSPTIGGDRRDRPSLAAGEARRGECDRDRPAIEQTERGRAGLHAARRRPVLGAEHDQRRPARAPRGRAALPASSRSRPRGAARPGRRARSRLRRAEPPCRPGPAPRAPDPPRPRAERRRARATRPPRPAAGASASASVSLAVPSYETMIVSATTPTRSPAQARAAGSSRSRCVPRSPATGTSDG